VTSRSQAQRCAAASVPCLVLDDDSVPRQPGGSGPRIAITPDDACYVIFTSGSTGRPKGVVNTHGGVHNRVMWGQSAMPLVPADGYVQKTPYTFDVSVMEFVWPLAAGARIIVARPGGHREPAYLVELVEREAATVIHFVPSMLRPFLAHLSGARRCASLRRMIASGEALSPDLCEALHAALGVELWNLYGPTEAAVEVSWWNDRQHPAPCPRPRSRAAADRRRGRDLHRR
jgi:non-ribosomal peptide synthetase component F